MNMVEIDEKELPEIKNPKHKAFILDYLKTYNQVKSYQKIYPNASYKSAMSSSSTLIKRYKDFIDTYHFLKMKSQLEKDREEAELYLNPFKAIAEKGKLAFSPDFKYPNVKNDALDDILEMSGGRVLAKYIADEMIERFGLMPEKETKKSEEGKPEDSKKTELTNKGE